jgi:polyribonucleotide nucleotidyltransferase
LVNADTGSRSATRRHTSVLGSGPRNAISSQQRRVSPRASIEDRPRRKLPLAYPASREKTAYDDSSNARRPPQHGGHRQRSFGTREITFSTGRLAQQAAGSALAQLGDTVVLSATTASKTPKEQFDFFPLTVDVEERMYAVGRIPGSFFRREGRPSEDAILTCRLIDRPLRPSFTKGLRNEVQVVETVLALDPQHPYDVGRHERRLDVDQALRPAVQRPGRLDPRRARRGPVGRVPDPGGAERATFDMVVAGRVLADGDVAIMMVEAEATPHAIKLIQAGAVAPTEEVVASGLEAAKPAIRELCRAQSELAEVAAKPVRSSRSSWTTRTTSTPPSPRPSRRGRRGAARSPARPSARRPWTASRTRRTSARGRVRGPREGDRAALPSVTKNEVRARVLRDQVRIDGRGPRDIRPLTAEVGVLPRVHGSALFERGETQILGVTTLNMLRMEQRWTRCRRRSPSATCTTTTSRRTRPVRPAGSARRSAARSVTARSPSGPCARCCRRARSSRTRSARSPRPWLQRLDLDGLGLRLDAVAAAAGVPLKAPVAGIAMGLISDEVDGKTST